MIADPEGPSFITRTVGRRRYADDASVSHDPPRELRCLRSTRPKVNCASSDCRACLRRVVPILIETDELIGKTRSVDLPMFGHDLNYDPSFMRAYCVKE